MGDAIHAPVHDRVRANTWPPVNQRLDTEAQLRLREAAAAASSDELTKRIDRERYGLKALRGDFTAIPPAGSAAAERASAVWKAVCE